MARGRIKKNLIQRKLERAWQRFTEVVKRNDIFFLITVSLLIGIGLCWVCSTTQMQILKKTGDLNFSHSKIINQLAALAIGLCGMSFMSVLDFERTIKKFRRFCIIILFYILKSVILAFAGQIWKHFWQPTHSLFLTHGLADSAPRRKPPTILPSSPLNSWSKLMSFRSRTRA